MPRKVITSLWEVTYMIINEETVRRFYHDSRTTEKTTKQASGNDALPAPLDKIQRSTSRSRVTIQYPSPCPTRRRSIPGCPALRCL
jgi:hypothetical protein